MVQFTMKKHHGYSIEEQDNMIPFERELHMKLIMQTIKEAERLARQQAPIA
jgi:hypothetical protein